MYFSYVDVCAILSDDRINNRAVKTLITKIAEEWVMINSRGFEEKMCIRDSIWGIRLSANSPEAWDPFRWRGQNLLGFALMEVRDELRRVTQNEMLLSLIHIFGREPDERILALLSKCPAWAEDYGVKLEFEIGGKQVRIVES